MSSTLDLCTPEISVVNVETRMCVARRPEFLADNAHDPVFVCFVFDKLMCE